MNKIPNHKIYSITALSVVKDCVVNIEVQGIITGMGNGHITLTGNLGDVAHETMLVAKTVCAYKNNQFNLFNYHIHFGFHSIKKDGPSWGLACYIMLSWLSGSLNYKEKIAATGEIDLKGNIKPVRYFNEKIAAWVASEIGYIITPKMTEQLSNQQIYPINHVDELNFIMKC